ncbi:hypothetical protein BDM02DRAFT_3265497 [Thelephora ganbajun]|uniref:Uncharacterized protein n=1 Tax=Thelephora ganbajun TaxID=370292 RepID=A0ACB6ZUG8_THEGA|nr:hypothetical protein BDM02DRAFT_3265497 [Thelephora ganbajun]
MTGKTRVLGADGSDVAPSQTSIHVKKQGRRPQTIGASNDVKAEIKGDNCLEEIVVQCPPVSTSRLRSTIQRASTLPSQQPPSSSNDPVQRSNTAPNLNFRSVSSTPKKSVRSRKSQSSNVGRSRVISISTDGSTTDEETGLPSPSTNPSSTLSLIFGRNFPSSPARETMPSHSSPARRGDQDGECQTRPRRCSPGTYEDQYNHQTTTARSVRGNKSNVPASPPKKVTNAPRTPVRSKTRRETSCQHQPVKKVVWGPSSSTYQPPSVQRGTSNSKSRPTCDCSGSRPPPSPSGSSHLTYVSEDERPAGGLGHSTGDSDYYTPSSGESEMSDVDPEPPKRVSCSTLNWKGKRRVSPPPPSSSNQCSSVKESRSSSPLLSADSSPRGPNSASGRSHKKRRDGYSRPPSLNGPICQESRDQTSAQGFSQALGQDICHCAGPCPSCLKPRFPFPPQYHSSMFHPGYYPYLYFPPSHTQAGYQLSHYGLLPYPHPYAIPQQSNPTPSISSAQPTPLLSGYPMPTPLATHPPAIDPLNVPVHASPAPAPTSSSPIPALSTSVPVPSPSLVSLPVEPPATKQVPPAFLQALDQFYQPQQRSVKVIDPSCDPRSPYSKKAAVPAFPNRQASHSRIVRLTLTTPSSSPIALGRPETPLSPLDGLELAL